MSETEKPPGYKFGRPTKYRPEMCDSIVEWGRQGWSLTEMRAELGIHNTTWACWIDPEHANFQPDFSRAVKDALEASQAWWERRGREATFDSKDFSATSYIFQMKNRFRETWRDKTEQEQSGSVKITWGKAE